MLVNEQGNWRIGRSTGNGSCAMPNDFAFNYRTILQR